MSRWSLGRSVCLFNAVWWPGQVGLCVSAHRCRVAGTGGSVFFLTAVGWPGTGWSAAESAVAPRSEPTAPPLVDAACRLKPCAARSSDCWRTSAATKRDSSKCWRVRLRRHRPPSPVIARHRPPSPAIARQSIGRGWCHQSIPVPARRRRRRRHENRRR